MNIISRVVSQFLRAAKKAVSVGLDFSSAAPFVTYHVVCYAPDGSIKWEERKRNLLTNEGLNDLLDKYFKGSAYTAAWYVGLKGAGSAAAGDTLASHAGWTEITAYTGNRQTLTLGTVSSQSVNNSASPAAFAITGTVTVAGAFLSTVATGTAGTLYSAADFSASRSVASGDTINVTASLSFSSA